MEVILAKCVGLGILPYSANWTNSVGNGIEMRKVSLVEPIKFLFAFLIVCCLFEVNQRRMY